DQHRRPAGRPAGQVRGAPPRARGRRSPDAVRARLRAHEPAGHRAELTLQPRRAALLLPRQGRAHHLLRTPVQGRVRAPLRRGRRGRHHRSGAGRVVRAGHGGHARGRRHRPPPLVRPARPGPVRGVLPHRRAGDRRPAGAHGPPRGHPLRRADRRHARRPARRRLRAVRRAVPAGAAAPPGRAGAGRGRPARAGPAADGGRRRL
ncbi:MAG: Transcriptional regulator, AcrR family, partial [uncultured Pseudonocardia sp.]